MEQSSIYMLYMFVQLCIFMFVQLYIEYIETCHSLKNQLQSLKTLESVTIVPEKKERRALIEEQLTRLGIFRDSILLPTFLKPT